MLNCAIGSEDRLKSQYRFQNAKTMEDFRLLYSLFYLNEICAPTTSTAFYPEREGEEHDNPQATHDLGLKFKKLVVDYGLIPFDSQVTIPYHQKGYMNAFVRRDRGMDMADEINRYSDVIAFISPIYNEYSSVDNLIFTYDATNEEKKQGYKAGKSLGDPYTRVALHRQWDSYELLREWMSDEVLEEFNPDDYAILLVIAPNFKSPETFVIDITLKALRSLYET
jgi:hypothetical protein